VTNIANYQGNIRRSKSNLIPFAIDLAVLAGLLVALAFSFSQLHQAISHQMYAGYFKAALATLSWLLVYDLLGRPRTTFSRHWAYSDANGAPVRRTGRLERGGDRSALLITRAALLPVIAIGLLVFVLSS
jgi:hypothetical protein